MRHINRYPAWPNGWHKKESGTRWVEVNQVVWPRAAAPLVFTEVDISGYTGAKVVWAVIGLTGGASGSYRAAFRTRGDTDNWLQAYIAASPYYGCSSGYAVGDGGNDSHFIVQTDASGVFEWCATETFNDELTLIGYVNDVVPAGDVLSNDAWPAGYSNIDASAILPVGRQLCFIKDAPTAASASGYPRSMRPAWLADDWTTRSSNTGHAGLGLAKVVGDATGMFTASDDAGQLTRWANSASHTSDTTLMGYTYLDLPPAGTGQIFVYGVAPYPAAELDASPAVGRRHALCVLRVNVTYSGIAMTTASFRQKGSAYTNMDWFKGIAQRSIGSGTRNGLVLVNTDIEGKLEWTCYDGSAARSASVEVLGYIPGVSA